MPRARKTRRNTATVSENVPENVVSIVRPGRIFHLRAPITLEEGRKGPYSTVEYPPLTILGYGRSRVDALESFADQFAGTWEFLAASDESMTGDARRLKREMLKLVDSVERRG